ncbi:MAG: HD domain-containing protein [Clostridium sp.]|uniref:HD domain-containing protein n=1 Tax=Clostridium sp. TaxID=1506 RepID=UPI00303E25E2
MDRVQKVRAYVNKIINNNSSQDYQKDAYIHTYGVAQLMSLMAMKQGLNTELAYIIGLLHDVYNYKTGISKYHSHSGMEMVRVALKYEFTDVFSEDEKMIILSAIFHHSDKNHSHDEYDEILKDSDVLQRILNGENTEFPNRIKPRINRLVQEFCIDNRHFIFNENKVSGEKNIEIDKRNLIANIAENLAAKKICGEKSNEDFIEIIKYYPENSAFDELRCNWCAAFVYHCCFEAGIKLPIKTANAEYRLAGVGAWYKWGMENDFCFYEKDGFVPSRGDVVIYNNIISQDNKPKDSSWHDHIGIVLAIDNEYLTVAEGNVNNENISGVLKRRRDNTIGCYLRIPNNYEYDGWKYDYKTGKIKATF